MKADSIVKALAGSYHLINTTRYVTQHNKTHTFSFLPSPPRPTYISEKLKELTKNKKKLSKRLPNTHPLQQRNDRHPDLHGMGLHVGQPRVDGPLQAAADHLLAAQRRRVGRGLGAGLPQLHVVRGAVPHQHGPAGVGDLGPGPARAHGDRQRADHGECHAGSELYRCEGGTGRGYDSRDLGGESRVEGSCLLEKDRLMDSSQWITLCRNMEACAAVQSVRYCSWWRWSCPGGSAPALGTENKREGRLACPNGEVLTGLST